MANILQENCLHQVDANVGFNGGPQSWSEMEWKCMSCKLPLLGANHEVGEPWTSNGVQGHSPKKLAEMPGADGHLQGSLEVMAALPNDATGDCGGACRRLFER